jgi:hypothetical protein
MDPKAGELRVTSPLLLRGEKVVLDLEGSSSVQKDRGVVQMYWPGQGLWVLSLHPLEGAVEGQVNLSRVKFEIDGQPYTFLMAAPVSRADHIWVLHDPNYKPSDANQKNGFLGGADEEHLANSTHIRLLTKWNSAGKKQNEVANRHLVSFVRCFAL